MTLQGITNKQSRMQAFPSLFTKNRCTCQMQPALNSHAAQGSLANPNQRNDRNLLLPVKSYSLRLPLASFWRLAFRCSHAVLVVAAGWVSCTAAAACLPTHHVPSRIVSDAAAAGLPLLRTHFFWSKARLLCLRATYAIRVHDAAHGRCTA